MQKASKLKYTQLRWTCDSKKFSFKTTKDVEPLDKIVGQPRALSAIKLGAELFGKGYNTFVTGLSGTGRMTAVKHLLENITDKCPPLFDYCYVNNFDDPQRPNLIKLAAGHGKRFADIVDDSIQFLIERLPQIFDEEPYMGQRKKILEKFQKNEKNLLSKFDKKIESNSFVRGQIDKEGGGSEADIFPVIEGTAYQIESLDALLAEKKISKAKKEEFEKLYSKFKEELYELAQASMKSMKVLRADLINNDKKAAKKIIDNTFDEIYEEYNIPSIKTYVDQSKDFLLNNLHTFITHSNQKIQGLTTSEGKVNIQDILAEFNVNIILDNSKTECAPVIIERTPNYINLFGTFERIMDNRGVWRTDFSKIIAGSVLQADQGYLIVNAQDLFSEPVVWQALKRVLLYSKLEIQPYESYLQVSQSQLKPEPIDVNIKVIIIGGQSLYNLLYNYEKGFKKIFKVLAQFDYETQINPDLIDNYVGFISKICNKENLPHCKPDGVARLIEWAVEHAGSQDRISLKFSDVADLLRESCYYAMKKGKNYVISTDVEKAIEDRRFRHNLLDEKMKNFILKGSQLIDTVGLKIGQINGLTVMSNGIIHFGKPARITASVGIGSEGIVNIEREAEMSGSIHTKGLLIIQGFLYDRFADQHPLSLYASLAFEQSYGGIDGDSASIAEVYVLLSAISKLPINQSIAVTGSINQMGEIQPIGGVNEKITGFYEICKHNGFNKQQGVIIPVQNVNDLMLDKNIISDVKKGNFHIWSVKNIEDAAPILMSKKFGNKDAKGNYPKDSITYLVKEKLYELYKNSLKPSEYEKTK